MAGENGAPDLNAAGNTATGSTGTGTDPQATGTGQPAGSTGQPSGGSDAGAQGSDAGKDTNGKVDAPAGSTDALKADLATERDKRQALETQVAQMAPFFEAVKGVFGGGSQSGEQLTPEQLQAKLTEVTADNTETKVELAVFKAASGVADANRLLDSRSFVNSLKGVDPTDTTAIAAKITAAITADGTLALQAPGAGSQDAGASGPAPVSTVDDWLRNAAKG